MQLKRVAEAKLPTPLGDFLMVEFEELAAGHDHAALVLAIFQVKRRYEMRVHSNVLPRDARESLRCDCGFQLEAALTLHIIIGRRTRYSDLPPSGRNCQYRPA